MTLIRWNPIRSSSSRDLASFQDEVGHMFDGFLSRGAFDRDVAPRFTPAVDLEETSDAFVVRVDLPGMTQKDVKVNLTGDTLTIRGERKQERRYDEHDFHRVERSRGRFERSFRFETSVRNEGVKATYRDGVLEVQVPKAEVARAREIEVQVGSQLEVCVSAGSDPPACRDGH